MTSMHLSFLNKCVILLRSNSSFCESTLAPIGNFWTACFEKSSTESYACTAALTVLTVYSTGSFNSFALCDAGTISS